MTDILLAVPFPMWVVLLVTLLVGILLKISNRNFVIGLCMWLVATVYFVVSNPMVQPMNNLRSEQLIQMQEETTEAKIEDKLLKPAMTEAERTEHLDSKLNALETLDTLK